MLSVGVWMCDYDKKYIEMAKGISGSQLLEYYMKYMVRFCVIETLQLD